MEENTAGNIIYPNTKQLLRERAQFLSEVHGVLYPYGRSVADYYRDEEGKIDYSRYDNGAIPVDEYQYDINKYRAYQQSGLAQFGAAINQLAIGIIVGQTVQAVGTILAMPEIVSGDFKIDNPIYKIGKGITEWAEKATPIYQTGERWSDFGHWAQGLVSIGSAASFLIPGYGIFKAVNYLGKLLRLSEFTTLALATGIGALANRHMEGAMEADQNYRVSEKKLTNIWRTGSFDDDSDNSILANLYKQKSIDISNILNKGDLKKGDKIREIEKISNLYDNEASKLINDAANIGARTDYLLNYANLIFDIVQFGALSKFWQKTSRRMAGAVERELIKAESKTLGMKAISEEALPKTRLDRIISGMTRGVKAYFPETTEGLEEVWNEISAHEGERAAMIASGVKKDDNSTFGERVLDYLGMDQTFDAFVFGALGGVAFQWLGGKIGFGADRDLLNKKIAETAARDRLLKETAQKIKEIQTDEKLTADQKAEEIKHLAYKTGYQIGLQASIYNNMDRVDAQMKSPGLISDLEKLEMGDKKSITETISTMHQAALEAEKNFNRYFSIVRNKNISHNAKIFFAQDAADLHSTIVGIGKEINDYKTKLGEAIKQYEEISGKSLNDIEKSILELTGLSVAIDELNKYSTNTVNSKNSREFSKNIIKKLEQRKLELEKQIGNTRVQGKDIGGVHIMTVLKYPNHLANIYTLEAARELHSEKLQKLMTEEGQKEYEKQVKKEIEEERKKKTEERQAREYNKNKDKTKSENQQNTSQQSTETPSTSKSTNNETGETGEAEETGKAEEPEETSKKDLPNIVPGRPGVIPEEEEKKEDDDSKSGGKETGHEVEPGEAGVSTEPYDLPDGRIEGTPYEVKDRTLYYNGQPVGNPNKKELGALAIEHAAFNVDPAQLQDVVDKIQKAIEQNNNKRKVDNQTNTLREEDKKRSETNAYADGKVTTPISLDETVFVEPIAPEAVRLAYSAVRFAREAAHNFTVEGATANNTVYIDLSDWESFPVGTKVTFELDTEFAGESYVYENRRRVVGENNEYVKTHKTYNDFVRQDGSIDTDNVPIKVVVRKSNKNIVIGYLPSIDFIEELDEYGRRKNLLENGRTQEEIEAEIDKLRTLRKTVAENKKVKSSIALKTAGYVQVEYTVNNQGKRVPKADTVAEAMPNLLSKAVPTYYEYNGTRLSPFTVFIDGKFIMTETDGKQEFPIDSVILHSNLKEKLKNGAIVLMVPSAIPNKFIPLVLHSTKLGTEFANILADIIRIGLVASRNNGQGIQDLNEIDGKLYKELLKAGFNIAKRKTLKKFLKQFVYVADDDAVLDLNTHGLQFNPKTSELSIYSDGKVTTLRLNDHKKLNSNIKIIASALANMYHSVNLKISGDIVLPVRNSNGLINITTVPVNKFLSTKLLTLGREYQNSKDIPVYAIQSKILFSDPELPKRKSNKTISNTSESIKQKDSTGISKKSVSELFESNPELANSVYEALGFTGNISDEQKQQQKADIERRRQEELELRNSIIPQVTGSKSYRESINDPNSINKGVWASEKEAEDSMWVEMQEVSDWIDSMVENNIPVQKIIDKVGRLIGMQGKASWMLLANERERLYRFIKAKSDGKISDSLIDILKNSREQINAKYDAELESLNNQTTSEQQTQAEQQKADIERRRQKVRGDALERIGVDRVGFDGKQRQEWEDAKNQDLKIATNHAIERLSKNPNVKIASLPSVYANAIKAELEIHGVKTTDKTSIFEIIEKLKEINAKYDAELESLNNQITPQQKQKAQELYAQYLEQNPNGSVEQFKNWVDSNQSNSSTKSQTTVSSKDSSESTSSDLKNKINNIINETSTDAFDDLSIESETDISIISSNEQVNKVEELLNKHGLTNEEYVSRKGEYLNNDGKMCSIKAAKGLKLNNFTTGSRWEVVKDLSGYPSHAQGGVDIKLDKNGVLFARSGKYIKAANGLVLSSKAVDSNKINTIPVSELYEQITGKPWSTAKEEGLTTGSYEDNIKLKQKLLSGEFNNKQSSNKIIQSKDFNKARTFKEAFRIARQQLGPNQIFEYKGRKYGTNLAGEEFNPSPETLAKHGMNKPEIIERLNVQNKTVSSVYSDKTTTKLEPEYKDWDEIKKRKQEFNSMEQADRIITYKSKYESSNNRPYAIIDKKKGKLHIYIPGNKKPIFSTDEISLGAVISDAQTVTKVSDPNKDGIITKEEAAVAKADFNAGNKSTGAGKYYISNVDKIGYKELPIINMMNERQYDKYTQTGEVENVATSFHIGYKPGYKRVSNGCIRCSKNTLNILSKYLTSGSELYILPEEEGNEFILSNGKLIFKSNSKKDYNTYVDSYGNVQKGQGINTSVNTLNYKPIKIEIDKDKFVRDKHKWYDFDENEEFETVKKFVKALEENKRDIMEIAKIDGDLYNDIALVALGILGNETNFGDTHSETGNIFRLINKGISTVNRKYLGFNFLPSVTSSPDYKVKYNISKLLSVVSGDNIDDYSVGLTQLRFKNIKVESEKQKEAIKAGKLPKNYVTLDKQLEQVGVTSAKDLIDPEKAAKATIIYLAYMAKNRADVDINNVIETLPGKWGGSSSDNKQTYTNNAIKNMQYFKLKQLD